MPLKTDLLEKCIEQARKLDTDAASRSFTEGEKRRLLALLTEAAEVFASLRDRLRSEMHPPVSDEAEAEERFRQKLIAEGFLAKPKDPYYRPVGDRTPIKVKGKPLSEIIIEERR